MILLVRPAANVAKAGRRSRSRMLRSGAVTLLACLSVGIVGAHAQDGTWTPGTSDWNTAANWTPSKTCLDVYAGGSLAALGGVCAKVARDWLQIREGNLVLLMPIAIMLELDRYRPS
jgi:hypothetical protein